MWKKYFLVSIIACALVAVPSSAPARLIQNWQYERLFKEADVVVFVTAVKTEASDDKPPEHEWPYEFVGQNSTFKVKHAIKGKVEDEQIKVLHYKFGKLKKDIDPTNLADQLIIDGPLLTTFRSKPLAITVDNERKSLPAPDYMLFLKKLKDGRYELVSGQIDPALSVKVVYGEGQGELPQIKMGR